jgi:hypothetical protein
LTIVGKYHVPTVGHFDLGWTSRNIFELSLKSQELSLHPAKLSEEDCSSLVYKEKHLTHDKTSLLLTEVFLYNN